VRWAGIEVLKKWTFSSKSDVWAFGVVMWEVYSEGKTPFENLKNDQVVDFVTSGGTLQVPESCPKEHAEWMTLCWSLKPESRPSFAELLKAIDIKESVQIDSSWKTASPSHQLRAMYVPDE
jgi:serine/threonine protein kinase